jgi:nucleotide-binding universal stress UspA family protein
MIDQKKKLVFHRILVPVTGTESDDETMRMACWIAKKDKSKLYAMYVITIKRSLPLEAEIESEAVERKIDLILMGVKYQRHFGQFSLGSIVPYILKNAPCQVMLFSQFNQL